MIELSPIKRPTALEVLKHKWFEDFHPDKLVPEHVDELDPDIFNRLRNYKGVSYFKRAAMNILVKMSTEEELTSMTEQFKALDVEGNGMIDTKVLAEYINKKHINMTEKDIKKMLNELNYSGSGKINYSEFLAATLDTKLIFNDAKLRAVFSMFDADGRGEISKEDLHFAFEKLGQEL